MNQKNRPIKLVHSIPGRLRFKIPAIRLQARTALDFESRIKKKQGVFWVSSNPKSASLIVRFDPRVLHPDQVIGLLTGTTEPGQPAPVSKTSAPAPPGGASRDATVKSALVRFLGLSFLAGGVLIREWVLKRPLVQSFFSPLGLITTLAAWPLAKKGLVSLKEGRLTLECFLGGSIMIAAAAGETLAALEILWITSGGDLLQAWITERSRRAIRAIIQVTSKEAYIMKEGVEVSVPVERVLPGDVVVLHTGEKIVVDGEVVRGEAVVDESPITGRAEPSFRSKGERVHAGTFVRQGVICVVAREVGDRTYLARILGMVEDALENKAPIQGVADRLAQRLVRIGLVSTVATLVLTRSFWRAFSVMLVMACPCATILAASTAISAAVNAAARRHILIKGGRYLEEAGQADVICFDKTGTLTTNQPELKHWVNLNGVPEDDLLQLAYSSEIHNSHPVALAIRREAENRGITPILHEVCEYFLGKGVRSEIRGEEILVGSHKLMEQFEVGSGVVQSHLVKYEKQGLTLIFIARNRELLGVAGFANQDRPEAAEVVRCLKRDGFKKTVMITGDSKYSAMEMAGRLEFDECRYSVLPGEKADIVSGLRKNGDKVFMVGDGINDALALAEADVGVAMGTGGSEVAIEAADIALVRDDLNGVLYIRALSRKTVQIVHQNFWIATGSNIAGVILGALGFLSPVMAGMVHMIHTLGVLGNSSRLLFFQPSQEKPTRPNPLAETSIGHEKCRSCPFGGRELQGKKLDSNLFNQSE